MKVAVVILNWNGCDMLRTFLPSVLTHSTGEGVAVYVADNGSTDPSVDMIQAEFPTVQLILLHQNYGFAEGYNRALQQIEAEYVVLLNSDVEVSEHWLQPLMAYLDTHPEVAACQPKIRSYHHREMFEYAGAAGGFIDRYGYPFCRGRIFGSVEKDEGQYDTIAPLFWATGAALFIRRADYMEAGGLDTRFFAHMEEIDLCWRLRARGRGIVCVPESVVYHVGGATLRKENPRKTFLNFRNNLLLLYKNLPTTELNSVMRLRRWLDYIAATVFLLKGDAKNARAVLRARREYQRLRPSFTAAREENLRKSTLQPIPERSTYSILWQFYAKGRRAFGKLNRSTLHGNQSATSHLARPS
ncbi:MAG: glycosyltransferase family 2 protein [Mediterranea sp.]|jgi:GT2 family glycosyltransferase|nr:glycosyltransferase family 2 protein [Mediterranea sp.]